MRYLSPLLAFFLMLVFITPMTAEAARGKARAKHAAPQSVGLSDPRYAALIMNPETGEVYASRDADGRRYPASLTKMMTLYLLFEALEQRKVSLDSDFEISEYATTMPQTNLALTAGDSMPVDTAIKALVVRSANDVAVVVAENLAGSAPQFATLMTAKARALGMRNTVFKNPNGLPNDAQYTTARDMAKLGIALKRDFPQYYPYFSVRQFSWEGSTYYTHNRVMLRYPGVDGIKTGYIGKSGFNLVTSCNRGGRPLVGVVMGGTSGAWRDNQMISLLDAGYKVIAERGQQSGRIYAANLPTPLGGNKQAIAQAQAAVQATTKEAAQLVVASASSEVTPAPEAKTVQVASVKADRGILKQDASATPSPTAIATPFTTPPSVPLTTEVQAPVKPPPPAATTPPQGGLTKPADVAAVWGIQVGAFSSQMLAEQAARLAVSQAQTALQQARMSVIGDGQPGSTIHRARLENLSENQAKKACEMLISRNSPCFIFRADAQNL